MTQEDFEMCANLLHNGAKIFTTLFMSSLAQSVKNAILEGIHPKMISKGSSGSYFARAKGSGGRVQTVA
jgi:hypothetical protein